MFGLASHGAGMAADADVLVDYKAVFQGALQLVIETVCFLADCGMRENQAEVQFDSKRLERVTYVNPL